MRVQLRVTPDHRLARKRVSSPLVWPMTDIDATCLEHLLDPAVIVLENGGTTMMADRALRQTLEGVGVRDACVVWRLDNVTMTLADGAQAASCVRLVRPVGVNVARVGEAAALAQRFSQGSMSREVLAREVERIRQIPTPNRWLVALAAAIACAAFSQIMTTDLSVLAVAATAGAVGQATRSQMQAWRIGRATAAMIASLASALIATAALRLGVTQAIGPALIASVIYAAPGVLLITGYIDFTSERFLFVGLQRLIDAGFLFLILTQSVLIADALL